MKRYICLITLALTTLLISSCSQEDDINEIFIGKTWYMTGGRLNGSALNTEVANFYTNPEAYVMIFQAGTFTGTLSSGVTFSGTWQVNAQNRKMSLNISRSTSMSLPFDNNVYTVLKNITYYKGDSNYLELFQDNNNFIRFSNTRSPNAN